MLRILGIITARGGSKGVPRKNIKDLCGKPLIAWTIEVGKQSQLLTDCIVSTDDEEIADVARSFGADVPFLRPAHLASDTASSIPVVLHALDWMFANKNKTYDAVMILQPTSPLRLAEDIDASIRFLEKTSADSVMSMVELENFSLKKLKKLEGDRILSLLDDEGKSSERRDQAEKVYKRNGAIYLTRIDIIRTGDLFGKDSRAYVMPMERSVDINRLDDFTLAEFYLTKAEKCT